MENVDVNGKSKAYLQGQKYVNLVNAAKCKRISLEQMQASPDIEATYIKISELDQNSCQITQFQFYGNSDLRYIINNQDSNGQWFSLIQNTRYLLLSTPEQVFNFIMYAINKSYPLSERLQYVDIQPNITLVLNNIDYFDSDHKNEYNLYQKLTAAFNNIWFDITETKSFQLLERILQYNILNNTSTTFTNQSNQNNTTKTNNHQLKIEWLTINTIEQLHFMMINRDQFKIIEEFRIVLPKQEINLDDIAPLLNITKELSVSGDAVLAEQATLDAITQIGNYAIKNITITIDSIKLDKLQKFIKHNADWVNTDITILCNTVTIDNINKLLRMSHKYANTIKQVVINDNIDKLDLDKIKKKFQNKIQQNDIQHQAKSLTNEKLLLKLQKINQEIVFFKQENQELKHKLIETELRSKVNAQQQLQLQDEFYRIIQQQQEQIKQLQEHLQMYNSIKLVSIPLEKRQAEQDTSKMISKLALHQIENIKVTFKPSTNEEEYLPQLIDVFGDKLKLSSQAEIRSLQKQLNKMQSDASVTQKSGDESLLSQDARKTNEQKPYQLQNYKNIRLKITKDQFKEVNNEKNEIAHEIKEENNEEQKPEVEEVRQQEDNQENQQTKEQESQE